MYSELIEELSDKNVTLVAVSKTKSEAEILLLYNQGQRIFGENRVQELSGKYENLPKDIEWHLIGSLQKNKVKYIAPFVTMIHSVDSFELAKKIDKEAAKNNRTIPVLLQIKIAQEDSKQGLDFIKDKLQIDEIIQKKWSNLEIAGVMGMASFVDDEKQVREEFASLKQVYESLSKSLDTSVFKEISMGMSGDYLLAISEGATMVRIGSLLFGTRI